MYDFIFKQFEDMTPEDYQRIGFMAGLEIHQQLLTEKKLFCRCPAGKYSDVYHAEILRHMRPTLSELGEYDGTALMEFKTKKDIRKILMMRFCEQTLATFTFDTLQYKLLVYPENGIGVNYTDEVSFELSDTVQNTKQVFGNDQYAKLKNLYYKVTCNADGRTIYLKLDTNALVKGSTQVNMPAIPFKTVTLKGDSIVFPKTYKGKYVLLDFWSTSCPHCIDDICNTYRNLYNKYAGDKFEIVGIADDPKIKVEKFVSQNMIKWTMIPAPKSSIQEQYKIDSYPALYLIDPNGLIIAKGKELSKEKIYEVFEKYLGNK